MYLFQRVQLTIDNPALVLKISWCRTGDKSFSESMMAMLTDASTSFGIDELNVSWYFSRSDRSHLNDVINSRNVVVSHHCDSVCWCSSIAWVRGHLEHFLECKHYHFERASNCCESLISHRLTDSNVLVTMAQLGYVVEQLKVMMTSWWKESRLRPWKKRRQGYFEKNKALFEIKQIK